MDIVGGDIVLFDLVFEINDRGLCSGAQTILLYGIEIEHVICCDMYSLRSHCTCIEDETTLKMVGISRTVYF